MVRAGSAAGAAAPCTCLTRARSLGKLEGTTRAVSSSLFACWSKRAAVSAASSMGGVEGMLGSWTSSCQRRSQGCSHSVILLWTTGPWELQGGTQQDAAGSFISLIYGLVCCWLELQAGLEASTTSGTRLCWPHARLARDVCMSGCRAGSLPHRGHSMASMGSSLQGLRAQEPNLPRSSGPGVPGVVTTE